jgi:hypothetical protein
MLDMAIATAGRQLWNTLCGLKIDVSIGGPIWAMKGWPQEQMFDQILTLDTAREHIVFSPFTRPDRQMVFYAATDRAPAGSQPGLAAAAGPVPAPNRHAAPARCSTSTAPGAAPMDYITEVNGSTLVGHYTSRYKNFDGLLVATRRRVFRRNPDNTINLNLPSITVDIRDVELVRSGGGQTQP